MRTAQAMSVDDVPIERRLASRASYIVHIKSPWTSSWKSTGTPLCDDSKVLDMTDGDEADRVCRRCASRFAKDHPVCGCTQPDCARCWPSWVKDRE